MSDSFIIDTMALVLRLERRRCPNQIKSIFQEAEDEIIKLYIPTIVLAEIGYLSERERIEIDLTKVNDYCQKYPSIQVENLTKEIIQRSFEINDIPELHDRLIAGTAYSKSLKIITNDPQIEDSKYVETIWR